MKTLFVLLLMVAPAVAAADLSSLDAAIAADMQKARVPGAAVVIVRDGAIVYERGYGVVSADDPKPVAPDTLFRLGSTAKMAVAFAATALRAEGRLDFQKPIATYASGLHPRIGKLTMQQLLTHTAGLRDEAPMNGPLDESAHAERVRKWDQEMFFTEPGEIFSYSNPGYVLAGYVLAEVTKKPFSEAIADLVLRPLGMSRSTFRPMSAMTWPLAVGHDPAGKPIRPFAEDASNYPPGSLFTSARELGALLVALLADGEAVQSMKKSQAAIPALDRSYGYGLELRTDRGVAIAGHTGARAGYGSIVWLIPEKKIGIAILTNRTGAIFFESMREAVGRFVDPKETAIGEAAVVAMTAGEVRGLAGEYVNGALPRVRLVAEETGLNMRIGEQTFPVTAIGGGRFRAAGAPPQLRTFMIIDGPSSKYIAAEHWALRRRTEN